MERGLSKYKAIGRLSMSGKLFIVVDRAIDIISFYQYLCDSYPTFQVKAIVKII